MVGDATGTLTVLEVIIPPTPASFTITSLEISPDEVDIGKEVSITIRVDNTGECEGVCQLVCKVNGVIMDEKDITLAGGSGESVVFTLTFDEAGKKMIEINDTIGSLIVKGYTPPPEQIPLPAVDEPETPSGEVAEASGSDLIEENGPTLERNLRFIWVIIGGCLVCIVVVVYFIRWQHRNISKN